MKFLNTSQEKTSWENSLINDLAFIKQHKRYPLGKRTVAPAALIGFALLAVVRVAWPFLFITASGASSESKSLLQWIFTLSLVVLLATVLYSFFKILRFEILKTPCHLQENIALLKKFFVSNHLAYTQHAEAAEVFMILSRNLDANPNRDYREVMVFIADDKQILVNSHFTGKKFNIAPPSRNYKRMARELQKWLNDEQIKNNDNSRLPVNSF